MIHNQKVVELARTWIGTPYHHQQSVKHVGCDCIGLIIGVWRELFNYVPDDFILPPYSPSWAEEAMDDLMVRMMRQYLVQVPCGTQVPGDALLYRMFRKGPTKHAALMASDNTIIQAYNGHDVMETGHINNVGAAITYVFRYPGKPNLGA